MRRRVLNKKKPFDIPLSDYVALYDTDTGEKFQTNNIGPYTKQYKTYDNVDNNRVIFKDNIKLIGFVAIPTSHNVYGDGSCGVMSYCNMRCDSLNSSLNATGDKTDFVSFGSQNDTESYFQNHTYIPNVSDNTANATLSYDTVGYLPIRSGVTNLVSADGFTKYFISATDLAPSPYNADLSRNAKYYEYPSYGFTFFTGIDGNSNCNKYLEKVTNNSWQTADSFYKFESDNGYYPAIFACKRFHSAGTNAGDWYLPSAFEAGYICTVDYTYLARLFSSNSHLFHSTDYPINPWTLTSTKYNEYSVCTVNISTGELTNTRKDYKQRCCLAFTHLILPIK